MNKIPNRSILIRRQALLSLNMSAAQISELFVFEFPVLETGKLFVFGPYFDFESMDEVMRRLSENGMEYWDDYYDFKEDLPDWLSYALIDEE